MKAKHILLFLLATAGVSSRAQTPALTRAMHEFTWQQTGGHPLPKHDPAAVLAQKIKTIRTIRTNKDLGEERLLEAYRYDSLGRITEIYRNEHGPAQKVIIHYNKAGLILEKTVYRDDKEITRHELTYDQTGRVVELRTTISGDPASPSTAPLKHELIDKTEIALQGDRIHYMPAEVRTQTFVYDDRNLKVKVSRWPDEDVVTYLFNSNGEQCELIYENKIQGIKRSQKENPCRHFYYRELDRVYPQGVGLLPVSGPFRATDTAVFIENGKRLTHFTYTHTFTPDTLSPEYARKKITLVRTLDEQGRLVKYVSETHVHDTLLLFSRTELYNEQGWLTDMQTFQSRHNTTDMAFMHYDQPPVPEDKYDHFTYTYYPSGTLRSKCMLGGNGKNIWCKETMIEYY